MALLKAMGGSGGGGGQNLDGIIDQLNILVDNLRKECYSQFATKQDVEKLDIRVDVEASKIRELERLAEVNRDEISACKDREAQNSHNIEDLKALLDALTNRVGDIDERALQDIEDLKRLEERLNSLPTGGSDNHSELEEILKKIKDLENEVSSKVDCDTFDNELAALRELIGNMDHDGTKPPIQVSALAKPAGPSISTKDLNLIKQILEKFPVLEET